MPTLTELIRDNFNVDPDVTTNAVFDAVGVPAKWRDLFYAVTRDECRRQARHVVRMHERAVDDDLDTIVSPTQTIGWTTPSTRPSAWVNVNDRTVYLRDRMAINSHGVYVLKGEATADQWMQRASFLASFRDGINATINDCEQIAKYLADNGIERLNDLVAVAA